MCGRRECGPEGARGSEVLRFNSLLRAEFLIIVEFHKQNSKNFASLQDTYAPFWVLKPQVHSMLMKPIGDPKVSQQRGRHCATVTPLGRQASQPA